MKRLFLLSLISVFFVGCFSAKKKETKASGEKKEVKSNKTHKEEEKNKEEDKAQNKEPQKPLWSYEGDSAPANWGKLAPENALCDSGQLQSPINLVWRKPLKEGGKLEFLYKPSTYGIEDTGNTIEVSFPEGQNFIAHGKTYELKSVQFHAQSEHQLSGKSYPAEIEFVHQNKEGAYAIVSAFIIEGEKNSFIDQIWGKIPSKKYQKLVDQVSSFNPENLLPAIKTHYNYEGSLTAPPCTEGVQWFVLNTPITFSQIQLAFFNTYYTKNNRPVQSLNKRKVTNY